MASKNEFTADDLAKIAASLSIVGYSLGLLALERAQEEEEEEKSKDNERMTAAINRMVRRFPR
jgi:preprotein translocase subunit SecF